MKTKSNPSSSIKILLVLILAMLIVISMDLNKKCDCKVTLENTNITNFNDSYKDFALESDINNFTKIKSYIDILNVTKEKYDLTKIIYHQDSTPCESHYYLSPDLKIREILLSYCSPENIKQIGVVRNYTLPLDSNKWDLFVFAHELGHYKFRGSGYEESFCDDFAYNLTEIGEKN